MVNDLIRTREFWNSSPCGGQTGIKERLRHRYALEPWAPSLLKRIADKNNSVLEIGCGQGTDGILLSTLLPHCGQYVGIDLSNKSIDSALQARMEANKYLQLNINPVFKVGNAEKLSEPDNSVDCVFSGGVLHHTPNPSLAFKEIYRVLKPGGEAFITLYRKPSVKVAIAKLFRGIQYILDRALTTDRCLYRLIYNRHQTDFLGTMLLEGFGVPVMHWYRKKELMREFSEFSILDICNVGYNIPYYRKNPSSKVPNGYMWLIHLKKELSMIRIH
ncbi:class I SAM-dependent methyltransferase [Candidatus Parcubacteria bacterium]|nr:MAG: class I SAM-dependent methyltransferase [Candidatus Parcubacteria bacterium]